MGLAEWKNSRTIQFVHQKKSQNPHFSIHEIQMLVGKVS